MQSNEKGFLKELIEKIAFLSFIVGYSQLIPSRSFRRVIAKSEFHRSWLAGNQGNINEPLGVLYRNWHTNRKNHKNATFNDICMNLRSFYKLEKGQLLLMAIFKDVIEDWKFAHVKK